MLSSDQKKIKSRLKNIYEPSSSNINIDHLSKQIQDIIARFNKKINKKKKIISEKTSVVICYGDSVFSSCLLYTSPSPRD